MNSLKRILSVIMVLAMLLSCMGAAPFEAVAGQTEQEGVTVSDMIEVENVPSEPESAAEPAEETEPAAEPAEETESAAEPAEETEPAAEPAEETEPAAEPAEAMTLSLENGIMPIAEPAPPEGAEKVTATWTVAEITYDGDPITEGTDIKAVYTDGVTGEPTYSYVDADNNPVVDKPTDAGTYTATATWEKSDGSSVYDTQVFTIKRAPLTVTINGGTFTQDYKGSEYTIEELSISDVNVTGTQNSETVTAEAVFWDENNAKRTDPVIDAGEYSVGYELTFGNAKETNYEVPSFTPQTLTISKAAATLTLNGEVTVVYTGANAVLTADKFSSLTLAAGDTLKSVTLADTAKTGKYPSLSVEKILATRGSGEVDVTANYDPITLTGTLTVEPKKLQAENVQNNIEEAIYDGTVQKKQPDITVNGVPISPEEFDFTYDPEEPVNVGEVTVTVTAKADGNYAFDGVSSVERKYKITPLSITDSRVTVEGLDSVITYGDGLEHKLAPQVTFNGELLKVGTEGAENDYTVTYKGDFDKAGTISVTIAGHGNFKDSRTETYTINAKSLADAVVTVKSEPTYTGSELTPEVEVVLDGVTLKETTDYTLEWKDNINAGENTASVTVKGKGNYTGTTKEQMFTIKPVTLTITSGSGEKIYDGKALTKEEATVTEGEFVSGEGATYTYTGTQTNVGASENTFSYKLNDGTRESNYSIKTVPGTLEVTKRPVTLTSATNSKEYDGTPLTDSTVTAEGFVEGEDATYDVTGTQTLVGSSDNAFTYTLNEGTKADNYEIKKVVGTLTVTDRSKPFEFTITAKSDETPVYDGEEHTVSGFVGNDKVTIGQDGTITVTEMVGETPVTYTVEGLSASAAGTDAGDYTSKVTGTAVVKDENGADVTTQFKVTLVDGTLTINKKDLSEVSYSELPTVTYNGTDYELKPVVTYGELTLKEGVDYKLLYENNIAAGENTATVTVEALEENYTGSKTLTFTIAKQSLDPKNDSTVSADASWKEFTNTFTINTEAEKGFVYDGKDHKWVPSVTYMQGYVKDEAEGVAVELPQEEYTVSYTRNGETTEDFTNVGTITVTITGNGKNFATDSISFEYDITKKSLGDENVIVDLDPPEMTYTGSALMPTVTVTYNGMTLAENTDYSLSWENNINVGSEAKVTLTAVENGNYKDSTVRTFTILPRALTAEGMSVSDIENVVYNGKSQMPEPVVEDGGKTLLEGTDYTLEYSENTTDVGTVTVTVTGAGNYAVEGVTVTKTYNITQKGITAADGVTVVAPDGVVYDGAAHAQKPTSVVDANVPQDRQALKEGIDYTLSWSGEKDDDKVTAAGTVTITVTGTGNYKDENSDATYAIRPQNIEEGGTDWLSVAVDDPIAETVYDSQAHQWEPQLTFTKAGEKGEKDTAMVKDTDYTVEYTRDDGMEVTDARFFKDVGTITVTIKGINNFTGTVVKSYKITKQPVTVKAAGAKLFGAVDPKFAIGATAEEAAIHNADNWLMVTFEGIIPGEETLFDGKGGDDVLSVTTAVRDQGEDKEQPGKYDIDVTVDDTKAANYAVTVDPNENAFTISDTAAFTVTLGDTERSDDIDTHTVGQVKYDIIANPRQTLISDLQSYINVALLVDVTEVAGNYVAPDAPDAQTKNVPESIAQDDRTDTEADADKTGKFTIPAIAYSAQHEGASPLTWHSGLPAGTKLTVKIESSKDAVSTVISPETVTVVAKAADMGSEYAAGTGKNAFLDGEPSVNGRVVLDASGTVTILPADGKEFIGADDWITLTVGEKIYHYSVNAYSELLGGAAPAADGTLILNLNMLKALAGVSGEEGGWFGANPTGKLTVSAVVFDGVNHTVGTTTLYVAFDTGAVDSTQTVENRITAETLQLAITDSVNAAPNVAANGQFGGASITEDIAAVGGAAGTLTWNNVTKWMQTPETLPHSGNTITITYLDCVGNQVNHTLTVVRSAAVTSNTLYVQPMKNDTVPGKSLTFYGETNAWEQGVLTVGGTSFPVEPIAGSERYDNGTKRWQVVVNLGDINFPVGEPTTVSMAYEDLNGGEATIRITYKDQAQTPILSSEPIEGSQAFWGYVESGATVSVSVYHADGTVTQIPQDNIAVDQFGYFYVRLSSPLEEGEQIVVSTSDFCDNQKSFTVNVQKELKADAKAEVLGANIIGELMGTSNIQHRFATPIDLGALDQAENKTMTLPILAYKSIEVGKITFSLQTPGKMNVSYNIKATNSIPVGGAARMKTFGTKPTIDELVSGELSTVVKDLKTSPAGSMPAIDVSAYQAEDGTYGGIVWLQFEFDVDMTEDNFVSRGGRDARFYRWLTESLQLESLLGAVYQETAAYEENVGYYNQYQKFENIARMN